MGYAELLMEEAADLHQERFVPELQKVYAAAAKLLALIDDIVRLPTIDASQAAAEMGRADISSFIRETMTAIRLPEVEGVAKVAYGSLLVVDDSETNRDILSRRLQRQGYTVAAAEHGHEALQMIQAHPFDLVLLDVMMPGMNGYEVLRRLKADAALRHIPVIMISALDEIDSVVRCIDLGAEDYLPKPFNPVLLQARIGACLEKKRLRDREVLYLQQIEAEKKRSDELLRVILPDPIVEELKATNTVRPRMYENVAVLFCDVVGFTPYCEQRQPEEVLASLQQQTEVYEELTMRHGIQKIRTIGDDFLATAGLLYAAENPVLDCVKCGLDMIVAAERLPAQWNVRVGIHVGPVMAGVVGHRQYMFDLFGDTVNTAKRVESYGANGAVNVSEKAWEQIADHCNAASLGLTMVKGKGPMELFQVLGLKGGGTDKVRG
jgi:CheY-like chemotaxis protein/class 3 adenylate cyclase